VAEFVRDQLTGIDLRKWGELQMNYREQSHTIPDDTISITVREKGSARALHAKIRKVQCMN
jgi:hypothetical protein